MDHDSGSKTRRARQRTARRLCSVHREQRRQRHQCHPEKSPLAGPGLPQVAGGTPHRTARPRQGTTHRSASEGLMQRTLESRVFISAILAMATGVFLFYTHPFPEEQIFLRVIALRAPQAFFSFKYLYYALLFTTPYLVCSTALSGLYIFTLKARRHISPERLPRYPDPRTRDDVFLVVGEVHNPRKPVPAKAPYWLTIPRRGLFT